MKMINIAGIISVILFYILILAVGMWAARKNTGGRDQEVRRSAPSLFVRGLPLMMSTKILDILTPPHLVHFWS